MARKYVSNKDESVRIFKSDILEWFTYVHPIVPHLIYLPIIALVLYLSHAADIPPASIGLLFVGGLALWTLAEYLVMTPSVSIPLAVFFFFVFWLAFGAGAGPALFGGFTFGYLVYDTIHYAVHHFSLHGRMMLYLKKKHLRHHYQNSRRDFGVSTPLWDWILRTA